MKKQRTKTRILLALIIVLIIGSVNAQENKITKVKQTEVLIIGTFHFNNPGLDIAKFDSFDILKKESQDELDDIAKKIKAYNPTKIFVEWNYKEQKELDSLFDSYKNNKFYNDTLNDFYQKNEIFQLAFRVGKLVHIDKLDAIDYNSIPFPFDKVLTSLKENNQKELEDEIMGTIKNMSTVFNEQLKKNTSLKAFLFYENSEEFRRIDTNLYQKILEAGNDTDFSGAQLTSEWFRRNLYMWSLIKKKTTAKDERIMVLLGASHITQLKKFINDSADWKTIELEEVITKN